MNSQKTKVTVEPTFTKEFGLVLNIYVHEAPSLPENVSPILKLFVNGEEVRQCKTGKDDKLKLMYKAAKTADDYELRLNDVAFHQGVC